MESRRSLGALTPRSTTQHSTQRQRTGSTVTSRDGRVPVPVPTLSRLETTLQSTHAQNYKFQPMSFLSTYSSSSSSSSEDANTDSASETETESDALQSPASSVMNPPFAPISFDKPGSQRPQRPSRPATRDTPAITSRTSSSSTAASSLGVRTPVNLDSNAFAGQQQQLLPALPPLPSPQHTRQVLWRAHVEKEMRDSTAKLSHDIEAARREMAETMLVLRQRNARLGNWDGGHRAMPSRRDTFTQNLGSPMHPSVSADSKYSQSSSIGSSSSSQGGMSRLRHQSMR